ncbi:MAG: OmpA family protein [Gammaproteobacteria bacterium]|nr:OmpA family protein [Gammaproteobacteria bacterium]
MSGWVNMEEAIANQEQVDEGSPAWVMTFADLMTLLMSFFVLLLSFSEMDALKFKQLAGSMKEAYGVQRDVNVKQTPKGINIIAREFSPGRPVMTIRNEVRQFTTQDMKRNLEVPDERTDKIEVSSPQAPQPEMVLSKKGLKDDKGTPGKQEAKNIVGVKSGKETPDTHGQHEGAKKLGLTGLGDSDKEFTSPVTDSKGDTQQSGTTLKGQEMAKAQDAQAAEDMASKIKGMPEQTEAGMDKDIQLAKSTAEKDLGILAKDDVGGVQGKEKDEALTKELKAIEKSLKKEIQQGLIQVVAEGSRIIIRIREKGSFPSGNADLIEPFYPILMKMSDILEASKGEFIVAGHTDSVPIRTARFRSNWDLSAARAATVAHELMAVSSIKPSRFRIEGYADTRPLDSNRTASGRAINRRVEVIIVQGKDAEGGSISVMKRNQSPDGARPARPVRSVPSATKVYPMEPDMPQLKGHTIPSTISTTTRK